MLLLPSGRHLLLVVGGGYLLLPVVRVNKRFHRPFQGGTCELLLGCRPSRFGLFLQLALGADPSGGLCLHQGLLGGGKLLRRQLRCVRFGWGVVSAGLLVLLGFPGNLVTAGWALQLLEDLGKESDEALFIACHIHEVFEDAFLRLRLLLFELRYTCL